MTEQPISRKHNPPLTREQVEQWAKTWRLSGGDLARALLAQDDALKQMTCLANKWYGYYESEFSVASDPLDHEWEDALWRARAAMLPREEVKDAISKR